MKCMAQTVLSGQEEQEISVNQSAWEGLLENA